MAVKAAKPALLDRVFQVAAKVYVSAGRSAGTLIGAAGMASITVGAGMVYLPAGLIVGGVLAIWFARLLGGSG